MMRLTCLMFAAITAGCTSTFYQGQQPQSYFDFPNSNVEAKGRVVGESSKTFFLTPAMVDSDMERDAIINALTQEPGADILIDYHQFQDRTTFPLFPFITTVTLRVEGTAAAAVVGMQELDELAAK